VTTVREPSASQGDEIAPVATRPRRRTARADALGIAVVVLIMLLGYFEVPFLGKTFDTSAGLVGLDGCRTAASRGVCGVGSQSDPRVDPNASAWQFRPWSELTHREIGAGAVPLWNPTEAAGAPLAANMQSAALDPLFLPVLVDPSPLTWDLTVLATFILGAVAAYVLVRVLGVGTLGAIVSGVVFGLSGNFLMYSNNTFARGYVYLPLTVLAVEWAVRSRRMLAVAAVGAAVAGSIYTGMPEITFGVLAVASTWALGRIFYGPRAASRGPTFARLAGGGALGIALAAPLLLPFAEYVRQSLNFKAHVGEGAFRTMEIVNWIMPKIRFVGTNDWNGTLNWIGAGALVLVAVAIASPSAMRRCIGWLPLVLLVGLLLKLYGFVLVNWVGKLPGAAQVYWPVFANAGAAFLAAILAGTGVDSLTRRGPDRRLLLIVGGALAAGVGVVLVKYHDQFRLDSSGLGVGRWGMALAVVLLLVAVVLFVKRPYTAVVASVLVVAELLVLAPRGFYYERSDPYPSTALTRALHELTDTPESPRIFSVDGLVFPDYAAAYGLQDLRVVDGIFVKRYFDYVKAFVSAGILDRWIATGPTETTPTIDDNPMFDALGVRYIPTTRADWIEQIEANPDGQFRLVGQYGDTWIVENTHALPRSWVVHDVVQVPDAAAALAALSDGRPRHADGSAVVGIDPRVTALVEADHDDATIRSLAAGRCPTAGASTSEIVSYHSDEITMRVHTDCPGLLVLSDTYYPGWKAQVNGRDATIHPTDELFRGVAVPAGDSTVTIRYRPASFRVGVLLALLALAAFGGVCVLVHLRRRRGGEAPDPPEDAAPAPTGEEDAHEELDGADRVQSSTARGREREALP
jgi:hypothetical protein